MGHLGTEGRFLRYWNTSFPPGVLVILRRFDRVLYDQPSAVCDALDHLVVLME